MRLAISLLWAANACDAEPVRVPTVPPGTVIANTPPVNWSHLVVKSRSTVGAGDIHKVPAKDVRMANKFNTVFLANVRRDNSGLFRLANLGVGCTVAINGFDTVIDPDTHSDLGADLSFFEGVLLKAIYKRQAKVSLIGYRPTLGIVDVPAAVRWQQSNQRLIIRYGLLVEPQTGELICLVWLIDPAATTSETAFASNIQCLPPNCIDHCQLYVDADEYRFGKIPSDVAYAVTSIPCGTMEFIPTKQTRRILSQHTYTPDQVLDAEQHLRALYNQQMARLQPNR